MINILFSLEIWFCLVPRRKIETDEFVRIINCILLLASHFTLFTSNFRAANNRNFIFGFNCCDIHNGRSLWLQIYLI